MTQYYGLACAIYGSPKKVTITQVGGEKKTTIRNLESVTRNFEHISRKHVEGLIKDTVEQAQDLLTKQTVGRVAIVTGAETGITATTILELMASLYGDIPMLELPIEDLSFQERLRLGTVTISDTCDRMKQYRGDGFSELLPYMYRSIVGHALQEYADRIYLAPPRGFEFASKVAQKIKPGEVAIDLRKILESDETQAHISPLLDRWESGDISVQQELLQFISGIAQQLVTLKSLTEGTDKTMPAVRFMYADDDLRSRLYQVTGAREAYARPFRLMFGIEHNICVKCKTDPISPPYADVAAACVADEMDKITGDKPGIVLLCHN